MFTNAVRSCSHLISREIFRNGFVNRIIRNASSVLNSELMSSMHQDGINEKNICMERVKFQKCNKIRALSNTTATAPAFVSKDEFQEFMSYFPYIVRDLTEDEEYKDIPEINKRLTEVLEYNVPNGKKNRGLGVIAAYKILESPENLTPENIRLANVLGWCVELLQGSFIIDDDIVDSSDMRRGFPCWHTREGVGIQAVNDALMLEHTQYSILKKYFSGHHCYLPTLELFHDVILKTAMGQSLDINLSVINGKPQLSAFTLPRYKAIAKYKTSFYTFHLPVTLAMYLVGKYDPEMHREANAILLELGHFYQVQNDYWDCFGDPKITGKSGADIRDGKCTWLALEALKIATPAQRQLLEDHYGRPDPKSEAIVRNLYEKLDLPNAYKIYAEQSFNDIIRHIRQISNNGLPQELFYRFVEKIYKKKYYM